MVGMWTEWLQDRDNPDAYCPYDPVTHRVILGFTMVGSPPGSVIGEFWTIEDGKIRVQITVTP